MQFSRQFPQNWNSILGSQCLHQKCELTVGSECFYNDTVEVKNTIFNVILKFYLDTPDKVKVRLLKLKKICISLYGGSHVEMQVIKYPPAHFST